MSTPDLGSKHLCPSCATKYYDLKKKDPVCPRCGEKPLPPSASKSSASTARASRARRSPVT